MKEMRSNGAVTITDQIVKHHEAPASDRVPKSIENSPSPQDVNHPILG